ncbi:MAG: hypothetical protein ACLQU1_32380 [Bryobacteraceae bacterium]
MNHDDRELDFIRRQLRSGLPPVKDAELQVDLWPRMLRRLEEPPVTFGWFESILVGLVAVTLAIFPKLLPAILYHL